MLEYFGTTWTEVMINLFAAIAIIILIIWAIAHSIIGKAAPTAPTRYQYPPYEYQRPEYRVTEREYGKKPEAPPPKPPPTTRPPAPGEPIEAEFRVVEDREARPGEEEVREVTAKQPRKIKDIIGIFGSKELDKLELELRVNIDGKISKGLADEGKTQTEIATIIGIITDAIIATEIAVAIDGSGAFTEQEKERFGSFVEKLCGRAGRYYPEWEKLGLEEIAGRIREQIGKSLREIEAQTAAAKKELGKIAGHLTNAESAQGELKEAGDEIKSVTKEITAQPAQVQAEIIGTIDKFRALIEKIDDLLLLLEHDRALAKDDIKETIKVLQSQMDRDRKMRRINELQQQSQRKRKLTSEKYNKLIGEAQKLIEQLEKAIGESKLEDGKKGYLQEKLEILKLRLENTQRFLP